MRMNSEDGRGERGGGYGGRWEVWSKEETKRRESRDGERERKGAERGLTLA